MDQMMLNYSADILVKSHTDSSGPRVLIKARMDWRPGERLGLVGPSGSGKSTFAKGLVKACSGKVLDRNLFFETSFSGPGPLRCILLSQNPEELFNPLESIEKNLEALKKSVQTPENPEREKKLLRALRLKRPLLSRRIDQFSGGECQRIALLLALWNRPDFLILDEASKGLDPFLVRELAQFLVDLQYEEGWTLLSISHDRDFLKNLCDRFFEIKNGRWGEFQAKDLELKRWSAMAPTKGDADCIQSRDLHPLLSVQDLAMGGRFPRVELQLFESEVGVLLGPTGAGKSSLLACLLGLQTPAAGKISWFSSPLQSWLCPRKKHEFRSRVSLVLQNSSLGLNRHHRVSDLLQEPLLIEGGHSAQKIHERVSQICELVELPSSLFSQKCHSLSGGERQRLALARALIREPRVVILDEALSQIDRDKALSLAVRLRDWMLPRKISLLLVTHDLEMADFFGDWFLFLFEEQVYKVRAPLLGRVHESPLVRDFLDSSPISRNVSSPEQA
ncbi:MAG: ATP-binding cassette domain-containing protein [Bdellovibrio sp.]